MSDFIYELMVDYDGTTRSQAHSQGLYTSLQAAERAAKSLKNVLGGWYIDKRRLQA